MKTTRKLIRLLAVSGVVALASTPMAFSAQNLDTTTGDGKHEKKGIYEMSQDKAAPNVYTGNRAGATGISDGDIESAVERVVKHYKDVSVDVKDGVVTLSGTVANEGERRDAVAAARDVAGARTVQDQIQVASDGSQSVGEFIDDAGITTAVKGKILVEKSLSALDISVDTVNGVVTLTGSAKSKELAERAGAIARQVKGVKHVDNKLLVKP